MSVPRSEWRGIEQVIARRLGGQLTPGSGSGRRKGDIHVGSWIVEVKYSRHPSRYVLQTEVLDKLVRYSAASGRSPCLVIWLGGLQNTNPAYVVPERIHLYHPNRAAPRSISLDLPCFGARIPSALADWIVVDEHTFIQQYLKG